MSGTGSRRTWRIRALVASTAFALMAAAGFGFVALKICVFANRTAVTPADAAIVLGAGLRGEFPSPVFRERINHGVALYQAGTVKKLIFTGGLGEGAAITESEAARRWAVGQGVTPSDILMENSSRTTFQNLRNAQQVAAENRLETFLIVSDPLHMKRALEMATDIGLRAQPSPTTTTMYRSSGSKLGLLIHETWYDVDYLLRGGR